MKREVMDQIVTLLAKECREAGSDLDELEGKVLECTRQLGQRTLQAVLEEKKGAMRDPRGAANVGNRLGSLVIGPRPS